MRRQDDISAFNVSLRHHNAHSYCDLEDYCFCQIDMCKRLMKTHDLPESHRLVDLLVSGRWLLI